MTSEAVRNFVKDPTVDGLKTLKKNELLELAEHSKVEDVKASLRKPVIPKKIAMFYADEDVFSVDDVDKFPDPSVRKTMSENEAKIQLMQLELEREKKKTTKEKD